MRANELVGALQAYVGLHLVDVRDGDRQEAMDATLEIVRGWSLARIVKARLERPDHPSRVADVHLEFRDGGREPAFTLSLLARDVHHLGLADVEGAADLVRTRVEILFKRGHLVTLELE